MGPVRPLRGEEKVHSLGKSQPQPSDFSARRSNKKLSVAHDQYYYPNIVFAARGSIGAALFFLFFFGDLLTCFPFYLPGCAPVPYPAGSDGMPTCCPTKIGKGAQPLWFICFAHLRRMAFAFFEPRNATCSATRRRGYALPKLAEPSERASLLVAARSS